MSDNEGRTDEHHGHGFDKWRTVFATVEKFTITARRTLLLSPFPVSKSWMVIKKLVALLAVALAALFSSCEPAPASVQENLRSRYTALKAEEQLLKMEIEMARARGETKASPELSRKVEDVTRRMYALTAEKLQADREGKK